MTATPPVAQSDRHRQEELIQREIAPIYEPQAQGLRHVLAQYNSQQLKLIADFLERVTSDPANQ